MGNAPGSVRPTTITTLQAAPWLVWTLAHPPRTPQPRMCSKQDLQHPHPRPTRTAEHTRSVCGTGLVACDLVWVAHHIPRRLHPLLPDEKSYYPLQAVADAANSFASRLS